MQEYEVVYTDINPTEIRTKLLALGATKKFERTYQRLNFEYPDWRLDKNDSWIRLRDEGDKITLTFKKRIGPGAGESGNDLGMEEIELEVSDYAKAKDFFLAIGLIIKHEVENIREHWLWHDIEFDIDTYPLIPPYLEIEAASWPQVEEGIEVLGLAKEKKKICCTYQIYEEAGINPAEYVIMNFDHQIRRGK